MSIHAASQQRITALYPTARKETPAVKPQETTVDRFERVSQRLTQIHDTILTAPSNWLPTTGSYLGNVCLAAATACAIGCAIPALAVFALPLGIAASMGFLAGLAIHVISKDLRDRRELARTQLMREEHCLNRDLRSIERELDALNAQALSNEVNRTAETPLASVSSTPKAA